MVKELENYKNAYFVAVVPDSSCVKEIVKELGFLNSEKKDYWKNFLKRFGYITWKSIKAFCEENKKDFENTLEVFDFNGRQIYLEDHKNK